MPPQERERPKCGICLREQPIEADWVTNGSLEDEQIDAPDSPHAYLNELCWEPEDDTCLARAMDLGRPNTYGDALAALQATQERVRELEEALEAEKRAREKAEREAEIWWAGTTDYWYERTQELERVAKAAQAMRDFHEARADQLQQLVDGAVEEFERRGAADDSTMTTDRQGWRDAAEYLRYKAASTQPSAQPRDTGEGR